MKKRVWIYFQQHYMDAFTNTINFVRATVRIISKFTSTKSKHAHHLAKYSIHQWIQSEFTDNLLSLTLLYILSKNV